MGNFRDKGSDHIRRGTERKAADIWSVISAKLHRLGYSRTGSDCESKFKSLKRTYTRKKQEKATGREGKKCEFYSLMDVLFCRGCRPYCSMLRLIRPVFDKIRSTTWASNEQCKRRRPVRVLEAILQNLQRWGKEERERYRHQLKMQRIKMKLLTRLVDTQVHRC
ncbi:uncharacterized protein LOC135384312 [Ornithodoros turicata]|uniref:uncharacterized protein LOC135384312 n=1 Tax=Ornithodoros turicata TaxID=34597 RepID=UPI00313A12EE